jgi:hypothetical protein
MPTYISHCWDNGTCNSMGFKDVLNEQFYNIDDLGSNSVSECCICPFCCSDQYLGFHLELFLIKKEF